MIKKLKENIRKLLRSQAAETAPRISVEDAEEQFKEEWKRKQRQNCIAETMAKTGWSREEAREHIKSARKRLGVSYNTYAKYNFHKLTEDEQAVRYAEILKASEERKAAENARKDMEREQHISNVMAATGWDRETTLSKYERCAAVAGCDYEHYDMFRMYELPEEKQKTYFTEQYTIELRKRYNIDPEIVHIFRNKEKTNRLLEGFLGRPWMSTIDMSYDSFRTVFSGESKLIYKPLSSFGGRGVEVFELSEENQEEIYRKLVALPAGIIEGFLKQHPQMAKLSVNSVNTIRVGTIKTNIGFSKVEKNSLHIVYAGLRMGGGNSYVDNLHSGGLVCGVNLRNGVVKTAGVSYSGEPFSVHPETGVRIKGFKIPYWKETKQLLNEASKCYKTGYFGWDIAITETGPVIIEVNTNPGSSIAQTPYIPKRRGRKHIITKFLQP